MDKLDLRQLRDIIQDSNINFLLGSGISTPLLKTLGSIEKLLTELEGYECDPAIKKVARVSLYRKYFNDVIRQNILILNNQSPEANLDNHKAFLKTMNFILSNRKSTILGKQINLFTTNVDIILERALEACQLEVNDGFNGRFSPTFSISNFKKSLFQKSLHYDNSTELPVFNLLKLHGSLTWQLMLDGNAITFSHDLATVQAIELKLVKEEGYVVIDEGSKIDDLVTECGKIKPHKQVDEFTKEYEKLLIVNPTKEKFKHTLLNQTYYDLLRIYANELEKENTILFVMGFSFADEHIREITLRVANSNPTLLVYVFAFDSQAAGIIRDRVGIDNVRNDNIKVIGPPSDSTKSGTLLFNYDLEHINKTVFSKILSDSSQE